jgi:hypothetical protein
MFCPECGTNLVEGSRFCYRCGCRLADYIPEMGELQPSGAGEKQIWGPHRTAAPPDTAPGEKEDAQLDVLSEQPSLRGPVVLIDLSHKERIREDHWALLRNRLREEGRVAIRTRQPVNPALLRGKRLLVIGAPEHRWVFGRGADRWQGEEIRAIERFVSRGNALWLMGDGLCNAEALSQVTAPYGIRFCADPVGAVTVSREEVYRHRLTRGIDEICLGSVRGVGGNYLQVEEPAMVLAEHNGRPVMAYCEHKGGKVLVLSSLSAFSQRHIAEGHNAALLDNILRHLLHFTPPAQVPLQPETLPADVHEPEQGQPEPADRPLDHDQAVHVPGTMAAGATATLQSQGPTISPNAESAGPSTECSDDCLTELDGDETDECEDWDSDYT